MNNNDLVLVSKNRKYIMGFAALLIFFFHTWNLVLNGNGIFGNIEIFIKRIGFCGVDIFFLLSGMGLIYSIEKGIKTFYFNRFKRLFFSFFIVGILYYLYYNWNFLYFLKNMFFYNFFFASIYSFLWFVPAITIFYLLFPLYYHFFKKSSNKYLYFLISIIIWFLLAFFLKKYIREDLYGVINRIPIFLTGIISGWYIKEEKFKLSKISWIIVILTLIFGLILSYLTNFKDLYILLPVSNCLPNYFIAISISIILGFLFEKINSIRKCKFINSFFLFYGSMSFQFYCVQELVATYFLTKIFTNTTSSILINITLIIVSTILARIILLLEKIFWKYINKSIKS